MESKTAGSESGIGKRDDGRGRAAWPMIGSRIAVVLAFAVTTSAWAGDALRVEVRGTAGGPRLYVNGEERMPRFYYGSDPCLFNLSNSDGRILNVPLLPPEDTKRGRVAFRGYPEIDPISFSDAALVDLTAGTTNRLQKSGEVVQARDHAFADLELVKGHRYWLSVRHSASRYRTYFDVETTYTDGEGRVKKLPDYKTIWQTFAVLLPVKSVGVMGDQRTYEYTCAIRSVNSIDAMTADWTHLPYETLATMSNRIINEVRGINRVVYDISSKPPATIEWE